MANNPKLFAASPSQKVLKHEKQDTLDYYSVKGGIAGQLR